MKEKIKLLVLPGDGAGQEVTEAVLPIFDKFNLPIHLEFGDIGWECWKESGDPVPQKTWDSLKRADATLLGAITSKPSKEAEAELSSLLQGKNLSYISPVIQLRQKLHLYANVRPIFDLSEKEKFNFCVIRENTEGLYSGLDYKCLPEKLRSFLKQEKKYSEEELDEMACTMRIQTKAALERIYQFAFKYAQENHLPKVTLADKPNVLRNSSQLAREVFESVAQSHSSIEYEIANIDAVGLWMVKRPEKFGVIVAENMFGDILSDVGAGVMGGLGFAPSANIGENSVYFEPVHGSAPNVPSNKANPSAMFLTVKLLLEHLGYQEEADHLLSALKRVLKEAKSLTYDLGGTTSTQEMAKAIINYC